MKVSIQTMYAIIWTYILLVNFLSGCEDQGLEGDTMGSVTTVITQPTEISLSDTIATPEPSRTPVVERTKATITPALTITNTPTLLTPSDGLGCKEPPHDYTRVRIGGQDGHMINQRTHVMLELAAALYRGEIDITGSAITQGSYTNTEPASFGTHQGGGAVDLSVIKLPEYTILYDEIDLLIKALRTAGFAAWLREPDELYPGSPIHIHAIAIGDKELSYTAQQQLIGKSGYFYGYSGIPSTGEPAADRHGGPIICGWMLELGYPDTTSTRLTDDHKEEEP